jgi:hypothetical protein
VVPQNILQNVLLPQLKEAKILLLNQRIIFSRTYSCGQQKHTFRRIILLHVSWQSDEMQAMLFVCPRAIIASWYGIHEQAFYCVELLAIRTVSTSPVSRNA